MSHEAYMRRCFDLARMGAGKVSPNPMVGALLVFEGRIIGEGFHRAYGMAHAEVDAVNSVAPEDEAHIPHSTLYVSLEPCCIFGNTPPCTDLIKKSGIKKVFISSLDLTPNVAGKSLDILRSYGVDVHTGILQEEGEKLARIRNTFVSRERPFLILKYAQSSDGFIGQQKKQVWLSNAFSKRLVHKWRSETDAILIGTNTALIDDPELTVRYYPGNNPLRIVLDRTGRLLNQGLHLMDGQYPTLLVSEEVKTGQINENFKIIQVSFDASFWHQLLKHLASEGISSLLVEGGAAVLTDLFENDLWDELRVFTSSNPIGSGITAPILPKQVILVDQEMIGSDQLKNYRNPKTISSTSPLR